MTKKLKLKDAAIASGALAAAMVPQHADADIVTVGGDGGVGTVTMQYGQDYTIGGLLDVPLFAGGYTANIFIIIGTNGSFGNTQNSAGAFVRSSVSTAGNLLGLNRAKYQGSLPNDPVLDSNDNWMPGTFHVNGVNGGNPIYGWAHFNLPSGYGAGTEPTLISFTYDDEATDATPFVKPIGGFSVAAVPEPSPVLGLGLLACGAAGISYRRRLAEARSDD